MSIDIDWDALTSGPEGAELAESIRAFIHEKFQQVPLPRFIRSVKVHSFDLGNTCPKIVLKDLSDPLPDFYEDDEDEDEDEPEHTGYASGGTEADVHANDAAGTPAPPAAAQSVIARRDVDKQLNINPEKNRPPEQFRPSGSRLHSNLSLVDQIASPLLSRSSTPGIPGGTSNLSYFGLPLAGRIQGNVSQNPMSAVRGWQEQQALYRSQMPSPHARFYQSASLPQVFDSRPRSPSVSSFPDPSTRPSTAHSQGTAHHTGAHQLADLASPRAASVAHEPDPSDLQIVLHISYDGNIQMSLTAEILLDFPMPSFVGIPFKLNITGLDFDGVALLAFLNVARSQQSQQEGSDRRAHFCFLSPEDAETLVGAENPLDEEEDGADGKEHSKKNGHGDKLGGLLRGIRVESELGKTKDGKQNLKNLGKVEKFILEQVRRIFEEEFVFPSFWTFLV